MSGPVLIYGGDPCPVCGVELDYDERGDDREPFLIHPDPQCGWSADSYPASAPTEPNPGRVGACPECAAYRSDGRPPYLHHPGCSREGDLQMERFLDEQARGDLGGPTLWR
jgi:hypothetical protein